MATVIIKLLGREIRMLWMFVEPVSKDTVASTVESVPNGYLMIPDVLGLTHCVTNEHDTHTHTASVSKHSPLLSPLTPLEFLGSSIKDSDGLFWSLYFSLTSHYIMSACAQQDVCVVLSWRQYICQTSQHGAAAGCETHWSVEHDLFAVSLLVLSFFL